MALPSAIPLGSCISGIPITLHYSFFLLLLVEFVYALRYTTTTPSYPIFTLFVVILYGPVLLFTILVHEFGHALTTKKLGGSVGGIVLWPLGGFALCGPTEALSGDLKVALMGPLMHIPMGFVWWIIYAGIAGSTHGYWPSMTIYLDVLSNSAAGFIEILSAQALYLNILLLCFNLFLPAYPLDGGRIYASTLILLFKLPPIKAAKVTAITAMLLSAGMILYSIISIFADSSGSELLLGIVGIFVFFQSHELWVSARTGALGNHPIFGRECYRTTTTTGGSSSGNNEGGDEQDTAVPAQSDEAAMA